MTMLQYIIIQYVHMAESRRRLDIVMVYLALAVWADTRRRLDLADGLPCIGSMG